MKNTLKTRTVQFSYGLVKDASLKVPVGPHSIYDIVSLIRESYLDWAFRPERRSIMSDEVVTSYHVNRDPIHVGTRVHRDPDR